VSGAATTATAPISSSWTGPPTGCGTAKTAASRLACRGPRRYVLSNPLDCLSEHLLDLDHGLPALGDSRLLQGRHREPTEGPSRRGTRRQCTDALEQVHRQVKAGILWRSLRRILKASANLPVTRANSRDSNGIRRSRSAPVPWLGSLALGPALPPVPLVLAALLVGAVGARVALAPSRSDAAGVLAAAVETWIIIGRGGQRLHHQLGNQR
jgi:hypothetical protein